MPVSPSHMLEDAGGSRNQLYEVCIQTYVVKCLALGYYCRHTIHKTFSQLQEVDLSAELLWQHTFSTNSSFPGISVALFLNL